MTRDTGSRLGAAVGSGILLALARPPFDLGPLALVALVGLMWAWRDVRPRAAAKYAFTAACAYYGVLVSWSWYFGAVAIVPFVVALAAYWATAGLVVGALDRHGLRGPWLVAAVWVLGEALVARWPVGGLSWGEVGYALHDVAPARALASFGGVPLVSFVVVAANGLVLDLVLAVRGRPRGPSRALLRAAAGLAVAVLLVPAVAVALRVEPTTTRHVRFALIQGNDKNRDLTELEEAARYLPESHFELADRISDPVDIIVFPESSMDEDPRIDTYLGDRLAGVARDHDAWVLANAIADAPDGRAINLNVLYGPDGELAGTYAKRHLVPFGEWVPLRGFLQRWIGALDQIPRDFAPGDQPGLFDVDGVRIATVICFESAFGHQIRPLVRDGAEVIVVSTNNRSYRRSGNSAQHVAIGQMRAAETGRPLVQAAISGITALIDADGDVVSTTALFDRTVVEADVAAATGTTPYVRYGEWVVYASLLAVGAAAVAGVARRRRGFVDSTDAMTEAAT